VRDAIIGALSRARALDLLDFLDGRGSGARFKEIQEEVANGVPSVATGLLSSLQGCGAIARDDSSGVPRYTLTEGGRVARECLHRASDALTNRREGKPRQKSRSVGRRQGTRERGGDQ
jgi:DNA-binding IclR family transcriptional regulator